MKKILMMAVCAISIFTHAQFNQFGTNFGQTNDEIRSI